MAEMRTYLFMPHLSLLFQAKNAKRAVKFLSLESLKQRCSDTQLPEFVFVEFCVSYFKRARCIITQT